MSFKRLNDGITSWSNEIVGWEYQPSSNSGGNQRTGGFILGRWQKYW